MAKTERVALDPDRRELCAALCERTQGSLPPGVEPRMTQVDVADAVSKFARAEVNRNDVSCAIRGKPIPVTKARAISTFVDSQPVKRQAAARYHAARWTSNLVQSGLSASSLPASDFKRDLLEVARSYQNFAEQALFVSRTGQWLKPILRRMLRCRVDVTVIIARPSAKAEVSGTPREMSQSLASRQFLWSLPNALDLRKADPDAGLLVKTFDWTPACRVGALAVFDRELVATSQGIADSKRRNGDDQAHEAPDWCAGHPLSADWPDGISEKYYVDADLKHSPAFKKKYDEAMSSVDGASSAEGLQGVREVCRWNGRSGFDVSDDRVFRLGEH